MLAAGIDRGDLIVLPHCQATSAIGRIVPAAGRVQTDLGGLIDRPRCQATLVTDQTGREEVTVQIDRDDPIDLADPVVGMESTDRVSGPTGSAMATNPVAQTARVAATCTDHPLGPTGLARAISTIVGLAPDAPATA